MSSILRRALHSKALKGTICKAEKWTQKSFNAVDWMEYEKAFLTAPISKRISITKMSHKLFNTNHQNKKYYGHSGTCPCCDLYDKNSTI
jgi:hypothetical protein